MALRDTLIIVLILAAMISVAMTKGGRGGGGRSRGGSRSRWGGRSRTRIRLVYVPIYTRGPGGVRECNITNSETGTFHVGPCKSSVDTGTILIICGVIGAVIAVVGYICCCKKKKSPISDYDSTQNLAPAPVTSHIPPTYPSYVNGTGATDIFSASSNPPMTTYDPPSYSVTTPAYPPNVPFNPDANPNYGAFNPDDTPKYGDNIGPSAPPPPPESGMDPSYGWTTQDPNGPPPPSYAAATRD